MSSCVKPSRQVFPKKWLAPFWLFDVIFLGKKILWRLLYAKAPLPIVWTLLGVSNITVFRLLAVMKALLMIFVTDFGMVTEVRAAQFLNAWEEKRREGEQCH